MSQITLRRLRQNAHIRALTREVRPHPEQFIQPLFVVEGLPGRETIPGLTGVYRDTPDSLLRQIESDLKAGCSKFLLFGVPMGRALKDIDWSFTAGQVAAIRKRFGADVWLSVDVCLCSSTPHGHCGVLNPEGDHLDNAASVKELAAAASAYAAAGADCVAPSDMMDGRIGAIREALAAAGLHRTLLMSYAAKFHSNFYGPFRVAADSAPKAGSAAAGLSNRASYQIDPARAGDALLCVERDVAEGADILMVKPGMPYLDLLADLSRQFAQPWAVYEVSGEYAGIELLAEQGLANRIGAHVEAWTAFVRAGASMIISYGARDAREWLAS
ncbi:MAG: porphobilinogen synthase [Nevskiaceae bacterium]|jgi:porphobilinogen synthase|nr:porphobilinogen synthase [Nevskiaceae bacterium]